MNGTRIDLCGRGQQPLGLCPPSETTLTLILFSVQFLDLRVAVLGNVDSGKSTLLGVLTQGELDNGRGRARLNLFRHLHEIQTGRTSSISFEILGFNSKGEVGVGSWGFCPVASIAAIDLASERKATVQSYTCRDSTSGVIFPKTMLIEGQSVRSCAAGNGDSFSSARLLFDSL